MHLCAGLTAASPIMEPFGEIGANFSLQFSSRTQFAKIIYKNSIAENQCEKHKKPEFSPIYVYGLPFTVLSSLMFARDFLKGKLYCSMPTN